MNPPKPKVSIGMPVYNGEAFIRKALDSLLAQTFTDFELIISDNASTDDTEAICREYAAKNQRIRYVRQSENRGGIANFQFVLEEAVGEYFMWSAADDYWDSSFVEKNIHFLNANESYVASITPVKMGELTGSDTIGYKALEEDSAEDRMIEYISYPAFNSRFYSLYRRIFLLNIPKVDKPFLGWDWYIVCSALRYGKFGCVSEMVGMERGVNGGSSDLVTLLRSARQTPVELVFPFFYFSKYCMQDLPISFRLLKVLFLLNWRWNKVYFKQRVLGLKRHFLI